MEGSTNPLKHPTKERPKTQMKRRPSKEFRRPGKGINASIGNTKTFLTEHSTGAERMLKLPPPPVPKKHSGNNGNSLHVDSTAKFNARGFSTTPSPPMLPGNEKLVMNRPNGMQGSKYKESSNTAVGFTKDHERYYALSADDQFSYSTEENQFLQEESELSFRDQLQMFKGLPPLTRTETSELGCKNQTGSSEIIELKESRFKSHSASSQPDPPAYNDPYLSKLEMGQSQLATLKTMLGYNSDEQTNGIEEPASIPNSNVSPLEPISMPSLFGVGKRRSTVNTNDDRDIPKNITNVTKSYTKENALRTQRNELCATKSLEVKPISGKEFIDFLTENKSGVTSSPCIDGPAGGHSISANLQQNTFDQDLSFDSMAGSLKESNPFKKDLDESMNQNNNADAHALYTEGKNDNNGSSSNIVFEPMRPLPPPPPGDFAPEAICSSGDEDSLLDPPTLFCDENENETVQGKEVNKPSANDCDSAKQDPTKSTSWSSFNSDSEDEDGVREKKFNLDEMVLKKVSSPTAKEDYEANIYEEVACKRKESTNSSDKASKSEPSEDRLLDVAVTEWQCKDVCNWLKLVGIGHLRQRFSDQGITGIQLMNINMELLDKINVTDMVDREIILSEIYNMKTSGDNPELSVLDALDTASGSDRDKMYALLEALRAPGGEELVSTYQPSCSTGLKKPVKPPKPARPARATRPISAPRDSNVSVLQKEIENLQKDDRTIPDKPKPSIDYSDKVAEDNTMDESKDSGKLKRSGRMKRSFKGALSLKRKGSNRLSKIFRQNSKTSLDGEQDIKQDGEIVQGSICIHTSEDSYTNIPISCMMTCKDVIRHVATNPELCLSDFKCYRLEHVVTSSSKKNPGETITILAMDELPLKLQMSGSSKETSRFLLKHFSDGQVEIHFPDDKINPLSFYVTNETTCNDVIDVLLCKKIMPTLKGNKEYSLAVGDQGSKVPVQGDVLILKVPGSLAKTKVFHMVSNDSFDDPLDTSQSEELINQFPDKNEISLKPDDGNLTTLKQLKEKLEVITKENQELKNNILLHKETISLQKEELQNVQLKENESTSATGKSPSSKEIQLWQNRYSALEEKHTALEERFQSLEKENCTLTKKNSILSKDNSNKSKELKTLEQQLDKLLTSPDERQSSASKTQDSPDQVNDLKLLLTEKESKLSQTVYGLQDRDKELYELRKEIINETQRGDSLNREKEILASQNKNLRNQVAELEENLIDGNISHTAMQDYDKGSSETSRREMASIQIQLHQKDDVISRLKNKLESNSRDLENKVEMLQNMITKKEVHMKEKEFSLLQECEELKIQLNNSQLQLKDASKLTKESKRRSADEEMKYHGRILHLEATVAEKNDIEHILRKTIHESESVYISQLNGMSRTLEDKDAVNKKLESRMAKIEMNQKDNLRKFEKFMSEKDKLIRQSTDENDSLIKDMREQLSTSEKNLSSREHQLRELKRASIAFKEKLESQLKGKDAQFTQHKFLLEKLLTFLSSRNPDLVQEFEEGFRNQSVAPDSTQTRTEKKDKKKDNIPSNDEWC